MRWQKRSNLLYRMIWSLEWCVSILYTLTLLSMWPKAAIGVGLFSLKKVIIYRRILPCEFRSPRSLGRNFFKHLLQLPLLLKYEWASIIDGQEVQAKCAARGMVQSRHVLVSTRFDSLCWSSDYRNGTNTGWWFINGSRSANLIIILHGHACKFSLPIQS